MIKSELGFKIQLPISLEEAQLAVTAALKSEGFGVLTEINVQATLKEKLEVDFHPYKILGACNPPIAHQALQAVPDVGLLLPCNVVLSQIEDNLVEVSIVDPLMMLGAITHPALTPLAKEAEYRLRQVVEKLENSNANL